MNKTPISSPLGPIVVGQFVGSNFAIEKILAVGSNCTIFSAKLNGNPQAAPTALKVENDEPSRNALAKEIHILRSIQNTKHFAKIIESGHHRQFNYVVIQLLGPSLRDLALRQPSYTFSLKILLKFAYQAIEALQTLHQAAFLHGSVNAVCSSNSLQTSGTFYLIDFSTCKPFNFTDTSRGTLQQQIFNSNAQSEQNSFQNMDEILVQNQQQLRQKSPEEDLVDVIKIISEYHTAQENEVDMINTFRVKKQIQLNQKEKIPSEFQNLYNAINYYIPKPVPNYNQLLQIIIKTAQVNNIDLNKPYDWEIEIEQKRKQLLTSQISNIQFKEQILEQLSSTNLLNIKPKLTNEDYQKRISMYNQILLAHQSNSQLIAQQQQMILHQAGLSNSSSFGSNFSSSGQLNQQQPQLNAIQTPQLKHRSSFSMTNFNQQLQIQPHQLLQQQQQQSSGNQQNKIMLQRRASSSLIIHRNSSSGENFIQQQFIPQINSSGLQMKLDMNNMNQSPQLAHSARQFPQLQQQQQYQQQQQQQQQQQYQSNSLKKQGSFSFTNKGKILLEKEFKQSQPQKLNDQQNSLELQQQQQQSLQEQSQKQLLNQNPSPKQISPLKQISPSNPEYQAYMQQHNQNLIQQGKNPHQPFLAYQQHPQISNQDIQSPIKQQQQQQQIYTTPQQLLNQHQLMNQQLQQQQLQQQTMSKSLSNIPQTQIQSQFQTPQVQQQQQMLLQNSFQQSQQGQNPNQNFQYNQNPLIQQQLLQKQKQNQNQQQFNNNEYFQHFNIEQQQQQIISSQNIQNSQQTQQIQQIQQISNNHEEEDELSSLSNLMLNKNVNNLLSAIQSESVVGGITPINTDRFLQQQYNYKTIDEEIIDENSKKNNQNSKEKDKDTYFDIMKQDNSEGNILQFINSQDSDQSHNENYNDLMEWLDKQEKIEQQYLHDQEAKLQFMIDLLEKQEKKQEVQKSELNKDQILNESSKANQKTEIYNKDLDQQQTSKNEKQYNENNKEIEKQAMKQQKQEIQQQDISKDIIIQFPSNELTFSSQLPIQQQKSQQEQFPDLNTQINEQSSDVRDLIRTNSTYSQNISNQSTIKNISDQSSNNILFNTSSQNILLNTSSSKNLVNSSSTRDVSPEHKEQVTLIENSANQLINSPLNVRQLQNNDNKTKIVKKIAHVNRLGNNQNVNDIFKQKEILSEIEEESQSIKQRSSDKDIDQTNGQNTLSTENNPQIVNFSIKINNNNILTQENLLQTPKITDKNINFNSLSKNTSLYSQYKQPDNLFQSGQFKNLTQNTLLDNQSSITSLTSSNQLHTITSQINSNSQLNPTKNSITNLQQQANLQQQITPKQNSDSSNSIKQPTSIIPQVQLETPNSSASTSPISIMSQNSNNKIQSNFSSPIVRRQAQSPTSNNQQLQIERRLSASQTPQASRSPLPCVSPTNSETPAPQIKQQVSLSNTHSTKRMIQSLQQQPQQGIQQQPQQNIQKSPQQSPQSNTSQQHSISPIRQISQQIPSFDINSSNQTTSQPTSFTLRPHGSNSQQFHTLQQQRTYSLGQQDALSQFFQAGNQQNCSSQSFSPLQISPSNNQTPVLNKKRKKLPSISGSPHDKEQPKQDIFQQPFEQQNSQQSQSQAVTTALSKTFTSLTISSSTSISSDALEHLLDNNANQSNTSINIDQNNINIEENSKNEQQNNTNLKQNIISFSPKSNVKLQNICQQVKRKIVQPIHSTLPSQTKSQIQQHKTTQIQVQQSSKKIQQSEQTQN